MIATTVTELDGAKVRRADPDEEFPRAGFILDVDNGPSVAVYFNAEARQWLVSINTEAYAPDDHAPDGCPYMDVILNDGTLYDQEGPRAPVFPPVPPTWQDAETVRERHDPVRVLPYVDAYWERRRALEATGGYRGHSQFYDLPGIAGCSRPESPVYVLGQLYELVRRHDEEADLARQGYLHVREMPANREERHEHIVVFAYHFVGDGSYQRWEWDDARLYSDQFGNPAAVAPKGSRRRKALPFQAVSVYVGSKP